MPTSRMNGLNSTSAVEYVNISTPAKSSSGQDENYDSEGAMKFIIATVLVYSVFGVFCTLLSRIKRGRGKSQIIHTQDEHIAKYLKESKTLKFDGYKMKLMFECNKYTDQVRLFEERMKLKDLEREMASSEYRHTSFAPPSSKSGKKKRKVSGIGAVGKMGMSLFYLGDPKPARAESTELVTLLETDSPRVIPSTDSTSDPGDGDRDKRFVVPALVTMRRDAHNISAPNVSDSYRADSDSHSASSGVHSASSPTVSDGHSASSPDVSEARSKSSNVKPVKSEICIKINVEDASAPIPVVRELETIRCPLPRTQPSNSTHSLETGL